MAIPASNWLFDCLNTVLLLFQIKRLRVKYQLKNPLLWVFCPLWVEVVKRTKNSGIIFHCVDALHTYDAGERFQQKFNQIARVADVVFTPNKRLYDDLIKLNPKTYEIGHGCSDLHLNFILSKEPKELENIPAPRVVYSGCLANWVDYDLLYESAKSLPNYSFVLIGYIHSLTPRNKINRVLGLKNVYHLGYINFDRLPEFYHACDVGIVPYQADNEHIQYCTPTKILDYFAAKLPCVSTRFFAVEELREYIAIADLPSDFAQSIKFTLENDNEAAREEGYRYAKERAWNNQVELMKQNILERLISA